MSELESAQWPQWLADEYQKSLSRDRNTNPEELRRVYDEVARTVSSVGYDPSTMYINNAVVVVGSPSPGRYERTFDITVNISYMSPVITPLDIADYVDRWVNYDLRFCEVSSRAFVFEQRGQQMPQLWSDVVPVTDGWDRAAYNNWFREVLKELEAALSIRIALTNIVASNEYAAVRYVENGNNYQSFRFTLRGIPQQHTDLVKKLFEEGLGEMTRDEEERLGYRQRKHEVEEQLPYVHFLDDGMVYIAPHTEDSE